MVGVGGLPETYDLYPPKAEATGSNPVGRANAFNYLAVIESSNAWPPPGKRVQVSVSESCVGLTPLLKDQRPFPVHWYQLVKFWISGVIPRRGMG